MIMGSKTNINMMKNLLGQKKPVAPKIVARAPLAEERADGKGELTPDALRIEVEAEEGPTTELRVGVSRVGVDGSRETTLEHDLTDLAQKSKDAPSGETRAPADGARKPHPAVVPRVAPVTSPPAAPAQKGGMDKLVAELTEKMVPILAAELARQLKPLQDGLANLENRFNAFMQGEGDVPESFELLNQELEELKTAVEKKADHSVTEALDDSISKLTKKVGDVEGAASAAKNAAGVAQEAAEEAGKVAAEAKSKADGLESGDVVPASMEALNADLEDVKGRLGPLEEGAKSALGGEYEGADAVKLTARIAASRIFVDYLMDELNEERAEAINNLLGQYGVPYSVKVLESLVSNPDNVSEDLAAIRQYRLADLAKPEECDSPTDAIDAREFVDARTKVVVQNAQYILEQLKAAEQGEQ